jgi:outer membrane biosynthesis protein TonB
MITCGSGVRVNLSEYQLVLTLVKRSETDVNHASDPRSLGMKRLVAAIALATFLGAGFVAVAEAQTAPTVTQSPPTAPQSSPTNAQPSPAPTAKSSATKRTTHKPVKHTKKKTRGKKSKTSKSSKGKPPSSTTKQGSLGGRAARVRDAA